MPTSSSEHGGSTTSERSEEFSETERPGRRRSYEPPKLVAVGNLHDVLAGNGSRMPDALPKGNTAPGQTG
jgi:hypothetical protein